MNLGPLTWDFQQGGGTPIHLSIDEKTSIYHDQKYLSKFAHTHTHTNGTRRGIEPGTSYLGPPTRG